MRQVYVSARLSWGIAAAATVRSSDIGVLKTLHCSFDAAMILDDVLTHHVCFPCLHGGQTTLYAVLLCVTGTRCAVNIPLIYKRFLQRKHVALSLPPRQWRPVVGLESLFLHGG